jgi:hypothetical protein
MGGDSFCRSGRGAVRNQLSCVKLLLREIPATMMAALLYLGAGSGMSVALFLSKRKGRTQRERPLTKKDLPYTIGMVGLDCSPHFSDAWAVKDNRRQCVAAQ